MEFFGEIAHKDTAIVTEKFQNFAAAFLAEHRGSPIVGSFVLLRLTLAEFRIFHKGKWRKRRETTRTRGG
jgi:hypothetical protein